MSVNLILPRCAVPMFVGLDRDNFGIYALNIYSVWCSRLKPSMPFKRDLALQNIPLSKQPFITQPQIENEDVI